MDSYQKPGYVDRDWRIVDYKVFQLPGVGLWCRGPKPEDLRRDRFFCCLGAAQTFGCFCPEPYPRILSESLGLPVLNLGVGGAGPRFFVQRPALLDVVNRARFCVVQVMPARSEDNARFESGGLELLEDRKTGRRLGADQAYADLLREHARLRLRLGRRVLLLWHKRKRELRRLVKETRDAYTANAVRLLDGIHVPKVLFYFSRRKPRYRESYTDVYRLFAEPPQLVNESMIRDQAAHADRLVSCVSRRGSPQPLRDRFTGKPAVVDLSRNREDLRGLWHENAYYPSPDMHQDAAHALLPACRELAAGE